MKPLISVLIPAYNAERFIAAAIGSVLSQSYTEFELLVFNDGSKDTTGAIIDSFKDPRIKVFHAPENKGHIHHLNLGLQMAQGKYIARMDADDICLKHRFEKQVNFLESYPDVGICGTQTTIINEDDQVMDKETLDQADAPLRIKLIFNTCFSHPSVMIRKSVLDTHGFYYSNAMFPAEDYAFWHLISTKAKLANLPDYLLEYRKHGKQISQVKQNLLDEALRKVQVDVVEHFLQRSVTSAEADLHRSLISGRYVVSMEYILRARDWLKGLLAQNRNTHYYDQVLLERYIGKVWFSLCTHAYKLGFRLVAIDWRSGFDNSAISGKDRVKFLAKSLLKYSPFEKISVEE